MVEVCFNGVCAVLRCRSALRLRFGAFEMISLELLSHLVWWFGSSESACLSFVSEYV